MPECVAIFELIAVRQFLGSRKHIIVNVEGRPHGITHYE
jgi:hypothetical protein